MSSHRDPEGIETRILHEIADLTDTHVLEIGCGDGRLTWRYASVARSAAAIDLDPQRLATALHDRDAPLRGKVTFMQASAEALPFPCERFDRALLAWSL